MTHISLIRFSSFLSSASTETKKDPEPKVGFSDAKSYSFVGKNSSRKTKIVIFSILTVALLGAVVSVSVYFALRKTTPKGPIPTRLVEVNLKEGDTLTYKVDQRIEISGNNEQKGMYTFPFRSSPPAV